ncbi:MAG TPA: Rieske 2Fe-2S domain-containing protein [Micromonosporaceae bacterium]
MRSGLRRDSTGSRRDVREMIVKLEQASRLDRIGDRLQRVVLKVLRPQRVRDFLHGVWLGHPLHPAMVQVPIGAWTSSAMLDLMPGQQRAADALLTVGTAAALPTAVAGLNDWASLSREQRRVGLVHAMSNTVGVGLFVASLAARMRGDYQRGRVLSFLGLTAATGGAYLGGHLAYKQGAAVNSGVPDLRHISEGWHSVAEFAALPEAELVNRQIGHVGVLLYREGDRVSALLDRCAHQSGPLSQGRIVRVDGQVCVMCPWHGSTYQLSDGEVVHGPAGTDQQVLPTRVVDGMVQARLP